MGAFGNGVAQKSLRLLLSFSPITASICWVFSVWLFCCYMWALHELHNSLNFTKTISKMICHSRRDKIISKMICHSRRDKIISKMIWHYRRERRKLFPVHKEWETDFYTPPVLGGGALFDNSAPAVYKNPVP